ncbi:MAG: D-tyrosyl-tRNA(Tyr) deacylase [Chloroflexi bacterium]|nr:D-tyrosyl-tRNA(Tyr) deacylase [Chloroflexota bacterium]
MRAVLQRVTVGAVRVEGQIVGSVGQGYVILVGVGHGDGDTQALWLARKISGLRVFEDDAGKFNRSLIDVDGGCLVVSQFTLYADARKGRRPSFTDAAPPDIAEPLIVRFADMLRQEGVSRVEMGQFGARMQVEIQNDGPVTILLDTVDMPQG